MKNTLVKEFLTEKELEQERQNLSEIFKQEEVIFRKDNIGLISALDSLMGEEAIDGFIGGFTQHLIEKELEKTVHEFMEFWSDTDTVVGRKLANQSSECDCDCEDEETFLLFDKTDEGLDLLGVFDTEDEVMGFVRLIELQSMITQEDRALAVVRTNIPMSL